ncbi:hypothetical protein [Variovorax sp. 770b2]|uniref:hypothetical protein n=1 Tax=Variovorax sp. 770b2 TaxID=1566271 RepID=UPI0008EA4C3A|nr:hypothetical protein [Variovorax sp. 770b2]SFP92902.1 hypothetical protein SAMN03159339_4686 [Variovorax sp. 770b2]
MKHTLDSASIAQPHARLHSRHLHLLSFALAGAAMLAGCGGSSDNGSAFPPIFGGGGGNNNPPPAQLDKPSIASRST